jgi:hypothetical protein
MPTMADENATPAADGQRWTIFEVYRTDTGRSYRRESGHGDLELRMGDLMEVADDAYEMLRDARGRNDFLHVVTTDGCAVMLDPGRIVSIEVEMAGPDDEKVDDVKPGRVQLDGGVIRNDPWTGGIE